MASRQWPELDYIKIPWSLMETLLDREMYDTEAQAAKALYNRCLYFFTGEEARLPKNLLREFRRFEKNEVDRYRNSVINGAKNRESHSGLPADTSDVGGTQTMTDTQGSGTALRSKNEEVRSKKKDNVNVDSPAEESTTFGAIASLTLEEKCDALFGYIEREEFEGYEILVNSASFENWVERWHDNGWVDMDGRDMDEIVTSRVTGERLPRWAVMLEGYARGMEERAGGF